MSKKTNTYEKIRTSLKREAVIAYSPIIRIYLLFIAAYYILVTSNHFSSESGWGLVGFASLSIFSSIAAILLSNSFKDNTSFTKLEIVGAIGNTLLLINLQYYYMLSYDSDRLVYYILMVIITSISSVSRRLGVASCILTLACMFITIQRYEPSLLQTYVYIGAASAIAALGVSALFRKTIFNVLDAKLYAANQKEIAVAAAEKATHLAITDSLTRLPNRRNFFDLLAQHSSHPPKKGRWAVLMIDLDGFKPVNDGYGHQVGDKLLVAVAERLKKELPGTASLARIGGDEFAALIAITSGDEMASAGQRICDVMKTPFNVDRVVVHVGASVGVASQTSVDMPLQDVLENADFALFRAKRKSKGQCAVFTPSDAGKMKRTFQIDQALRRCDLEEELTVVYQPQFNIIEKRVTGYESLARWKSSELGDVSPGEFIAVAESSGMITQVTQVLLKKALKDFQDWPFDISLSFNLSMHDILNHKAVDDILEIARRSGISPNRICFEITESVVMGDVAKATQALRRLTDAGHEIALDDFGTGYSNFEYLHRLPVQKIKIDRSFVRNVAARERSSQIIATMISLVRSLNKECIIEGVETEAEFAAVQLLGASNVQGYYCGRPMSAENVMLLEAEIVEMHKAMSG